MLLECPVCQAINRHISILGLNIERVKVYYFRCRLCETTYQHNEKLPEIIMETK